MKQKRRLLVLILTIALCIVVIGMSTYQYWGPLPYDPHDIESQCDERNVILPIETLMIREGMSYSQAILRIGKATRHTGSGFFILEYDITDGRKFHIYIDNSSGDPDKNTRICDDSWIIDACGISED